MLDLYYKGGNEGSKMAGFEDCSFNNPREPSFYQRCKLQFTQRYLFPLKEDDERTTAGNVKVYLRIKPLTKDASLLLGPPQEEAFIVKNPHKLSVRSTKDQVSHEFQFTKIFKGDISQEELYNESVNPLVKSFVNGHNCLLFAYGTSSAGKTYTIQGNPKEPGVLPRALSVVFSSIKGKGSCTCRFKPDMVDRVVELDDKTVQQELAYKQKIMTWSQGNDHSRFNKYSQISDSGFDAHSEVSGVSIQNQDFVSNLFHELQLSNDSIVSLDGQDDFVYSVWVSFAEIYNENIFDLLEPVPTRGQKRPPLALGEDCDGQVYIKGLRHIWVSSGEEAYQVLLFGQHNLKFAPTALNSVSSRSHCIFTIKLLQHVKVQQPKRVRVSMFSFCDLAGAERVKNTQNVGERLRESQNINTSLHVLGRCLTTIRDNNTQKAKKLIPFRNSKLTRLFQRALTGRESISMIVNINPTPLLRDETFNVLTFSAIAKQIILKPERHKKRNPRNSRFSQYISRLGNSSKEVSVDDTFGSTASSQEVEGLHKQIEKLNGIIKNLQSRLEEERNAKLIAETKIRSELCDYFNGLMHKTREVWKSELENTRLRYEEMNDWRVSKIQEYYALKKSKKRRRKDDDDEDDDDDDDDDGESFQQDESLAEKLQITNELLKVAEKEKIELNKKCSKFTIDLAHYQGALRNAEKVLEAKQISQYEGNESALTKELELQLKTLKEECNTKEEEIQKLKDVLEDAKEDFVQLENDYKVVEKERDDLEIKVIEQDSENKQNLAALRSKQVKLDQQCCILDQKDERIETLEFQLKQLQVTDEENGEQKKKKVSELESKIEEIQNKLKDMERLLEVKTEEYLNLEADFKEVQRKNKELEVTILQKDTQINEYIVKYHDVGEILEDQSCSLDEKDEKISFLEKQLEKLKLEIEVKREDESNHLLMVEELKTKLKDSEEKLLNLEKHEEINQKEIQELKSMRDNLEDKLHHVEKAEKNAIKDMINAQSSEEEKRKEMETLKQKYENIIAELKVKLQSYTDTAVLVKSMKEQLESKSEKYEEIELQNTGLIKSLETKELEMKHFLENRDELIKKYEDLLKKEREESEKHKREVCAYQQMFTKNTPTPSKSEYEAKLQRLQDSVKNKDKELKLLSYHLSTLQIEHSKCVPQDDGDNDDRVLGNVRGRKVGSKKLTDENVQPSLLSSEDKRASRRTTRATEQKQSDKSRRGRRRMLFTDDPNNSKEFSPCEVVDTVTSLKPERLLRSRRM